MRFSDFKYKLVESQEDQLAGDLKVIGQEIADAEKSDELLARKAKSLLQTLVNKTKAYLDKTQQPVAEDAATYAVIDTLKQNIATICATVPDCEPTVRE